MRRVPSEISSSQVFAFAICFVTNQHTTEVEALLTRQISIVFRRAPFPNFEIFKFPDVRFVTRRLENLVLTHRRKINVLWGDHGQNGRF